MVQLKSVKGEEFIKKVLEGERDFSGIKLEKRFDLSGHEGFGELQQYLKAQDFEKRPIILENARLRYVKARGLYLPFVKARNADITGAEFREANLSHSDFGYGKFNYAHLENTELSNMNLEYAILKMAHFTNSNLEYSNLKDALLVRTVFRDANLSYSDLRNTKIGWANFQNTNFEHADLRDVKNLRDSLNLDSAKFFETKVTSKEKAIISTLLSWKNFRIYPLDIVLADEKVQAKLKKYRLC